MPFASFTLIFLASVISALENLIDGLATLRRDVGRRVDRFERVDRRSHDVVRIGRTVALGENVRHTDDIEHRAHRAARDDARSVRRWLHVDARRAMLPGDGVVQRALLQPHLDHLAARLLHRLLHGDGHFLRLAFAHADAAVAVPHDGERREAEDSTTLHDLRDAVDRNHLLAQAVAAIVLLLRLTWIGTLLCHRAIPQNLRPPSRAASASALTRP